MDADDDLMFDTQIENWDVTKDIPSSTHLPGNGARKELDVYYLTLFL